MNRFYKHKQSGFTLVELLVALMIGAIVLAAAATMADALACGKETCDRMSHSMAYLLQIQTRLSDLIMRANTVMIDSGNLTLEYDTDGDGTTDNEIEIGTDGQSIIIDGVTYKYQLKNQAGVYQNAQSNVQFDVDVINGKLVTITFVLTEDGTPQTYQVCAALRGK